jgi:hypothetical protein
LSSLSLSTGCVSMARRRKLLWTVDGWWRLRLRREWLLLLLLSHGAVQRRSFAGGAPCGRCRMGSWCKREDARLFLYCCWSLRRRTVLVAGCCWCRRKNHCWGQVVFFRGKEEVSGFQLITARREFFNSDTEGGWFSSSCAWPAQLWPRERSGLRHCWEKKKTRVRCFFLFIFFFNSSSFCFFFFF